MAPGGGSGAGVSIIVQLNINEDGNFKKVFLCIVVAVVGVEGCWADLHLDGDKGLGGEGSKGGDHQGQVGCAALLW